MEKLLRRMALELIAEHIKTKTHFKLVLWNHNNWDKPLPKTIMEKHPYQYILDIDDWSLEYSYIKNKDIYLKVYIQDQEYFKKLEASDIYAVLTETTEPQLVIHGAPEMAENMFDASWEELEWILENETGIEKRQIKKSLGAFRK